MSTLEDRPLNIYSSREFDHRTNPNGGKTSWDLKKLHETSHEILNLKSQGFNNIQIAATLGVHEATVKSIANSSLGKEKLTIMRGVRDGEAFDIVKEVQERARKCMAVIDEALDDEIQIPLKDKAVLAMNTLKLGGFEAPKKLDARFAHMHALDPATLELIKNRARELGLVVQSLNKEVGVACGGEADEHSKKGNGDGKASIGAIGSNGELEQAGSSQEDKEA